jgi:HK97 gp10 family phage protein
MAIMDIKLTGFAELEAKLKRIGPRAARKVGAKAIREAAKPIIDKAKALVPVRTGKLEDSITYVATRARGNQQLSGKVGFKTPASRYAHFVEYGTAHNSPQPFMRPAIDSQAENSIAIMGKVMWDGVAAEAKKR